MVETILIIGIIAIIILILLTLLAAVVYSGLLENVQVGAGNPPVKNLVVAYKSEQGPYKNVGDLFTRTFALAPDNRTFGIYYDDPREVPAESCRYAIGSILAEGQEKADENLCDKMVKNGYHLYTFPAVTNCVKTTFPYRTSLSCLIAAYRVYPMLSSYIKENRLCAHPMLEIYDGDEIKYMAPLAKQDEFYVPEVRKDDEDDDDESVVTDSSHNSSTTEPVTSPGPVLTPLTKLVTSPEVISEEKEMSPDRETPSEPPTPTEESKSSENEGSSASSFEDLNMDHDDIKKWSELSNEEVTQPEN